ncbi:hypothetical protein H257_00368 [Aphanomyces astaci]|uniref:Uncharacterized protein n=1 Tax=Aphanomyces astaci TaxID=112090 RepID=W4HBH5_APHAT|nr:hypothetical protein H257_00368 [Aphanomyces astaci]ETV88921.1 hypothetical protein H257_00368 [Aphanomyces astaci]|eukprot:XP_009821321.1 hypothetical protein H257_00368 [Aphanomyces astaci]
MEHMDVGAENTPQIRRQLLFQGLSIKQTESQFHSDRVDTAPTHGAAKVSSFSAAKKGSTKQRRALGDISNNKTAQFHDFQTPRKGGAGEKAGDAEDAVSKLASFPSVTTKPRTDEDIELAYGGISAADTDALHMKELKQQMDAEILSWQQEVDAAQSAEPVEMPLDDLDDVTHCNFPPIHLDHDLPPSDALHDVDSLDIPPLFEDVKLEFEIHGESLTHPSI